MARSPNILYLFQIMLSYWMLLILSLGLVLTWALIYLQGTRDRRRPGINIKEFL